MLVAYFVHDLSDTGVARRVRMLQDAGAEVRVIGFRRQGRTPCAFDGAPSIELGLTHDGGFRRRALSVARQLLRAPALAGHLGRPDVILARNLEMIVIAAVARALHAPQSRLAYECIDIHRLMLSQRWTGRALRLVERAMLRRSQLLIVSSPAFLRAYFEPRQKLSRRGPATLLVENKVLELRPSPGAGAPARVPGPPWRIAWFGMLRCHKSLDLLRRLAEARPGLVEIMIAGRPSARELPDFEAVVAASPGISFIGSYAPDQLAGLYRQAHFAWAIDYFEEGGNSAWLLPNRIYEGGLHAATPIALRGSETGDWLEARGLGVVMREPAEELAPFLESLDAERYRALEERSRRAPRAWFAAGRRDGRELLQALAGAA
ncbi:MAG TPA: glycosyltransferase [Caulobacteraceae bacterium]|nr:glycosyltransferase [Caulobacteraceae bacterium]